MTMGLDVDDLHAASLTRVSSDHNWHKQVPDALRSERDQLSLESRMPRDTFHGRPTNVESVRSGRHSTWTHGPMFGLSTILARGTR